MANIQQDRPTTHFSLRVKPGLSSLKIINLAGVGTLKMQVFPLVKNQIWTADDQGLHELLFVPLVLPKL